MSFDNRCLPVLISIFAAGFVGCAHMAEELPPASEAAMEGPVTSAPIPSSYHTVAPGETVWAIARRYDLTVDELADRNAIADVRQLPVGRELIVPAPAQQEPALLLPDVPAPAQQEPALLLPDVPALAQQEPAPLLPDVAAAPVRVPDPESRTYRVRRGETLWRIAQRHGIAVSELAAMNGMQEPERIRAGRVIQIPDDMPSQECVCESPVPTEIAIPEPVECEAPPAPVLPPVECEAPPVPALPPVAAPPPVQVSAMSYVAIDSVLGVGDGYLDSARFEEAIDMADLGLDLLGEFWIRDDAGPRIARAELLRGIAHVALERPSEGRASFRAALRVEPEIMVGADASPKVQEIFDSAREEVTAALER